MLYTHRDRNILILPILNIVLAGSADSSPALKSISALVDETGNQPGILFITPL